MEGILAVLGNHGPGWGYATVLAICALHAIGRPVYVTAADSSTMPANLSASPWFVDRGKTETQIYPDYGADLLIVYPMRFGFVLRFYGRHLTNQIVGKFDHSMLQEPCAAIEHLAAKSSRKLFVVDQFGEVANKCSSICEPVGREGCMLRMPSSDSGDRSMTNAHHKKRLGHGAVTDLPK